MQDHDHGHDTIDPRIEAAAAEGCSESRLYINRRALLGASASLSAWAFMPRSSSAAGNNDDEKRLLVVLLQGGLDGLHLVAPLGDPAYDRWRNGLRQSASDMHELDSSRFFYLNNSMPKFLEAYRDGDAAIVHAIAPPLQIRSHFDCMYNLEAGTNGRTGSKTVKSGWMNRLLQFLPQGQQIAGVDPTPKGLRLGGAPLILTGSQPVLTWTPDRWAWPVSIVQDLYSDKKRLGGGDAELSKYLALGDSVRNMALTRAATNTSSDATNTPIVDVAFHGAGKLMAANPGPRVAAIQIVGFDVHKGEKSSMVGLLSYLDSCLQNFRDGLGEAAWRNTVVACVSEFGRTVWDNGRDGTDHGIGTVSLLLGGAVAGGRVITDWPGLATLQDGRDLRATICTRRLFKGIIMDHFGIDSETLLEVFPESTDARPLEGLIKSAGGGPRQRRPVGSGQSSGQTTQSQTPPTQPTTGMM